MLGRLQLGEMISEKYFARHPQLRRDSYLVRYLNSSTSFPELGSRYFEEPLLARAGRATKGMRGDLRNYP